jgi:formate dehydrogenase major subunit
VNGALHTVGLRALDWLAVHDFQLTETAEFWRIAPEIEPRRCANARHRQGGFLLPGGGAHG